VEWILDWLFYVAHLGVDRVVLYDNGSDNVEELERALSEVSTELSIVLVDWPYPYGPIRSYYNQFCQATQNNHVYQCFGAADWVGHFDIDEYLIRASDASVVEGSLKELVRNTRSHIGLLRFDSYWIPRLEEGSSHQLPTVRQFTSRMRRLRGRAHKYLMRASAYRMANTHNGKVQFGFFRKAVKAHHWVFLHYKPLTTNWRSYVVRGTAEEYDSELHIEDKRIANFFNDTD
jgi:hypothetical protein